MKLSIIIVSFNVKKALRNCLNSLNNYSDSKNTEIFIIDNNSMDGSQEMVKKEFSHVKLIENPENIGFGKANNQALRKAQGEYIFLLNPDTEVVNNAVDRLVKYLKNNEDVGIVGPKLLNSDGSIQKEMSRFPSFVDTVLILLKFHRLPFFGHFVYDSYDYEKIQEADHLMGAALFIRKAVFDRIGFFDENFFLWFEETDLEKRAKDAGWKIVYYPKAQVKHLLNQSIGKLDPFKKQTIWNHSLWYYFKKHRPDYELFMLIPFLLISYLTVAFSYAGKRILGRWIT